MVSLQRPSSEVAARPGKRQSDMISETEITSPSASDSEYEERKPRARQIRKSAPNITRRRIKRRRANKLEIKARPQAPQRAVSSASISPPEEFSVGNVRVEVGGEQFEYVQGSPPSLGHLLRWKDILYPGLPQIGYAFSYASAAVCFLKVPASASKTLAVHWRSPQSYVAYVIYSLHHLPEMDNKLRGLEMVNELAAHGFIEDDECKVQEEMVQRSRALTFQWGDVAVSISNLGDASSFQGYWPGSRVDDEDRKVISTRLQSVMHDRALPAHALPVRASRSPASPQSVGCSGEPRVCGSIISISSDEDLPAPSGKDVSLEDSGLIKFVKVPWRQSKWAVDNLNLAQSQRSSQADRPSNSDGTGPGDEDFKAVILWSNKAEKKEGIDLVESMVRARLGSKNHDNAKEPVEPEEVMEGAEKWLVYHKDGAVVGFPGRYGDEEFVESVQAMEK